MRSYGCIASGVSDKDILYEPFVGEIPTDYRRSPVSAVTDQGSEGSCVSQSIWELYSFYRASSPVKKDEFLNDPAYLFRKRKDKTLDGMTPREGFEILKDEGKILTYVRLPNILAIKYSVLTLGGVMIGLVAKSSGYDFWDGDRIIGGHAVAVIGYDEDWLYFKNSWGLDYGTNGLWKIHKYDFDNITEAWAILS